MKDRPWLEKEDPQWAQQVKWNNAREIMFDNWDNSRVAVVMAKHCPLIEEAQWYLSIVPCTYMHFERRFIIERLMTLDRDPRALAYIGVIDRDDAALKEAALLSNPIAQCWLAEQDRYLEDRPHLLIKSMAGGYSEAFVEAAADYIATARPIEAKHCLVKGIEAGSIKSMVAYAWQDDTNQLHRIYWLGRSWLERIYGPNNFIKLCMEWSTRPKDVTYGNRGFIYGQIFDRLDEDKRRRISDSRDHQEMYRVLTIAREVYLKMCQNASRATYAWLIAGKRLRVIKDVSKIIAKMVWGSRDTGEWYLGQDI